MSKFVFFKEAELIGDEMLISVANGMEGYALAVNKLRSYFHGLANNLDMNIKAVIGGFHRGYTAVTVADYLIVSDYSEHLLTTVNNTQPVGRVAYNLLSERMYSLMEYKFGHWGEQYNYTPSLEERRQDPLEIQRDINERAKQVAEFTSAQPVLFGQYQPNASTVWGGDELEILKLYREEVKAAILARLAQFIIEKDEA